jgi:hypothetical protein
MARQALLSKQGRRHVAYVVVLELVKMIQLACLTP